MDNELRHYQRAFRNNWLLDIVSDRKYTTFIAEDDKAYLARTSLSMDRTWTHVLHLVNPEKAKELQQHDFADNRLDVTSLAHWVMQKVKDDLNGKPDLKSIEDHTFMYKKSKNYIGKYCAIIHKMFVHFCDATCDEYLSYLNGSEAWCFWG